MSKLRFAIIVALLAFAVSAARADEIQITGSGTFASAPNGTTIPNTVATTPWSAPGATWSFTMLLADPTPVIGGGTTPGVFQTTSFISFSYLLNGAPVNVAGSPIADVFWYPFSPGDNVLGGFDINFAANNSVAPTGTFNVHGPVVFTGGLTTFAITSPASYSNVLVDFDLSSQCDPSLPTCTSLTDTGTGTGNITVSTIAATPEPATLMLLASGLSALLLRRKK